MLTLDKTSVSYAAHTVVSDVSFSLHKGEIGCILGPSGCGKSTLLRAIAGFEPLQAGEICLRGKLASSPSHTTAPEQRHIALVFQDFALFPHLSVAQNIAFGLHGWKKAARQARVNELLALVALEDYATRYPHTLSGGQQQRVALARALAPQPDVLLLDEPFSSLDSELRASLATELRQIIKQQNTTALLVTHDQQEAFAFADSIGVLQQGQLHQWGTAYELYHQPQSRFVADFIGQGVFLPAQVNEEGQLHTQLGDFPPECQVKVGQQLELLVRPDDVQHWDDSPVNAEVVSRAFQGAHILYQLKLPDSGQQLLCLAPSHHDHQVGEQFGIKLDLAHLVYFAC